MTENKPEMNRSNWDMELATKEQQRLVSSIEQNRGRILASGYMMFGSSIGFEGWEDVVPSKFEIEGGIKAIRTGPEKMGGDGSVPGTVMVLAYTPDKVEIKVEGVSDIHSQEDFSKRRSELKEAGWDSSPSLFHDRVPPQRMVAFRLKEPANSPS